VYACAEHRTTVDHQNLSGGLFMLQDIATIILEMMVVGGNGPGRGVGETTDTTFM